MVLRTLKERPDMLFLMNDQVIDLRDVQTTIKECSGALSRIPPYRLSAKNIVELGKGLFYDCQPGQRPDERALLALGALLADKLEADAALFIRPENATSHHDVHIRLADVPLTVLVHLQQFQNGGAVPSRMVNDAVWLSAA